MTPPPDPAAAATGSMRCAFLTTSVSRLSGGLFVVMRGLGNGLRQLGVDLTILGVADARTADDLPAWAPLDVRVHAGRPPRAFGRAAGYAATLDATQAALIHNHGLWQYPSLAGLRWARHHRRPYCVSPHGMLDPWALTHQRWKKRLVATWFQDAHLQGAACLHAVSPAEADAIRLLGLRNPVCVVPNGVDYPAPRTAAAPPWSASLPAGCRVVLFLGRLHTKKGLTELIDGWSACCKARPGEADAWALVIAGWDEGGLRARLEQQVRALDLAARVRFVGPLDGDAKAAAYQHAAAFILPSFSEGMPAAVLEAWAYGLPVLMTPACNIPEGFAADAALRIAPEPPSITAGLDRLLAMTPDERRRMGQRGERLIAERFAWPILARDMHAVYTWMLGRGSPPACVRMA